MSVELRLPNITSATAVGQLSQLQSYVYQLVQQLNFALNSIEQAESGDKSAAVVMASAHGEPTPEEAQETFSSIKSLIIKSADIVKAYGDVIESRMESSYEALSDFGTYKKQIQKNTKDTADVKKEHWEAIEKLNETLATTNAYMHTGFLGEDPVTGAKIFGVEVGQTREVNGVKEFTHSARFTDDGVYFYSAGSNEPVAYLNNQTLYITDAVITRSFKLGGYQVDFTDGMIFKWVGD